MVDNKPGEASTNIVGEFNPHGCPILLVLRQPKDCKLTKLVNYFRGNSKRKQTDFLSFFFFSLNTDSSRQWLINNYLGHRAHVFGGFMRLFSFSCFCYVLFCFLLILLSFFFFFL